MEVEKRQAQHKARMLEALEQTLGVVTAACQQAGISRSQYYKYLKDDTEFREAAEAIQNITLDFVESQLFRQIREGNTHATIFYLKTKGKDRGYVESPLIDINTFNPIQILLPNGVNPFPTLDITDVQDGEEE